MSSRRDRGLEDVHDYGTEERGRPDDDCATREQGADDRSRRGRVAVFGIGHECGMRVEYRDGITENMDNCAVLPLVVDVAESSGSRGPRAGGSRGNAVDGSLAGRRRGVEGDGGDDRWSMERIDREGNGVCLAS